MSTTFRELLSMHTDAVERPGPLAAGHYIGILKGHEYGATRHKQTPYIRFFFTPTEETADVEPGANGDIDLTKRELRKDFYLTPQAIYRLSDFLDAVLGRETGRSFDERIPDTRGVRVVFKVTTRESQDGSEIYNDVGDVVKA